MKDKLLLSIKETSDLFGIGQHRLRDIIREDYEDYPCEMTMTRWRTLNLQSLL